MSCLSFKFHLFLVVSHPFDRENWAETLQLSEENFPVEMTHSHSRGILQDLIWPLEKVRDESIFRDDFPLICDG